MLVLAALLVVVALGLLAAGFSAGDGVLLWTSVAVSVLAAVLLAVQALRTRRSTGGAPAAGDEGGPAPATGPLHAAPDLEPGVPRPRPGTEDGEPPGEIVEVTDLLVVLDLTDEVVVVDEHPRYHLTGCPTTQGQPTTALPLDEARSDGFTACGVCAPDRHLAALERARQAGSAGADPA